jgi:hypothetical protein
MNRNEQLLEQVAMLKRYIKDGSCPNKEFGLCNNVLISFDDGFDFDWDTVFGSWPECSNNLCFPIEGNWSDYHENNLKHDRRTIWGKRRLSLSKHCLEYTQKKLAELNE